MQKFSEVLPGLEYTAISIFEREKFFLQKVSQRYTISLRVR